MNGVSCVTTIPGCIAMVQALEALQQNPTPRVRAIQDWAAAMNEVPVTA
jgi:carbamoyl-phosphate synthase large subunit